MIHWLVGEPFEWWKRWMATAFLKPPSPLVLPHFAPLPALAQVSTGCLGGVRGSLWQKWASGLQLRLLKWVDKKKGQMLILGELFFFAPDWVGRKCLQYLLVSVLQGRSFRESTLKRAQRRSFTPASFMEEDVIDFPDELDTSFFARVRSHNQHSPFHLFYFAYFCFIDALEYTFKDPTKPKCVHLSPFSALECCRIFWCKRSCPRMQTRCLSLRLKPSSKRPLLAAKTMRWSWQAVP